jgi:dimeric dUTPase (all-alpha-NTP-PPase superfamily)
MKFLKEVYERNKILDQIFIDKFEKIDKDMYKKNKLELLVEIGELANESKCFKYWSKKEVNRELMLLEFADCIIMTLCLFNYNNLELLDKEYKVLDDPSDQIAYLYKLCSEFYFTDNTELLHEILFNFINLGKLLNITKEEIVKASIKKIDLDIEDM